MEGEESLSSWNERGTKNMNEMNHKNKLNWLIVLQFWEKSLDLLNNGSVCVCVCMCVGVGVGVYIWKNFLTTTSIIR